MVYWADRSQMRQLLAEQTSGEWCWQSLDKRAKQNAHIHTHTSAGIHACHQKGGALREHRRTRCCCDELTSKAPKLAQSPS